jgi:hypothetical protein
MNDPSPSPILTPPDTPIPASASSPTTQSVISPVQGQNKSTTGARSALAWVEQNQGLAVSIAFLLTLLYVSPVFIISLVAWTSSGFQDAGFWFAWFAAFMKTSDSTLNQFHKILFPVITALSVIAFRGKPNKLMLLLGAFILFSFTVTTFAAVIFDMKSTQLALSGLPDTIDMKLVKAFFTRVEETLLMYLMMLLGISVVNAAK